MKRRITILKHRDRAVSSKRRLKKPAAQKIPTAKTRDELIKCDYER